MKTLISRRNIVLFATAAVVAAAVAVWTLNAPAVEAAGGQSCRCSPEFSTSVVTGESTVDCLWAEMEALHQAQALVNQQCSGGTCYEDFVVIDDNNCQKFWPEGVFRVTGRIDYACEFCRDIPDRP